MGPNANNALERFLDAFLTELDEACRPLYVSKSEYPLDQTVIDHICMEACCFYVAFKGMDESPGQLSEGLLAFYRSLPQEETVHAFIEQVEEIVGQSALEKAKKGYVLCPRLGGLEASISAYFQN